MVYYCFYQSKVFFNIVICYLFTDHPVKVQTIKQVPAGPVNVNTSITLICSVSGGIPLPTLFWNCGGIVNNTLTNNSTISQLSIVASKYHNQEVCSCSAFYPIENYRTDVQQTLYVLCK